MKINPRIKILKLYERTERGMMIGSIIAYEKYEMVMDYDMIERKYVCVQWQNYLRINLWFIILDFTWTSRHKDYKLPITPKNNE